VRDEGPSPAKPRQPGRIPAVLLALAVHAAFFGLIVFGVSWQNRPAPPLEAELWKDLPPVKAAKSAEPAPAPEPPAPEPAKPEPPKPEPPKPPPKPEPAKAEPPKPDPAIAEKREREKKEQEKRERLEREKKEKEKLEKEKAEKQKAEEVRKKREADEAERKRKAEEDKARVAKAKAEAEAKAAAEAVAATRQNEVNLYRGRIRDKIRGRANVPDTVTGKPEVEVRITLLPGGEVLDIKLVKSSGNRIYDEAILRAIRSASPLPVPPAHSELFPQFRDLILKIEHER
jgi:colicin import membrane protein